MPKTIARGQITISLAIPGEDAVVYSLQPSATSVSRDKKGYCTPPGISCQVVKKVGNNLPELQLDAVVKYMTSAFEDEKSYMMQTSFLIQPSWKWVEFVLYSSATKGVVLDRVRVPVVSDAQSSDVAATVDEAVNALKIGKYNILRNSGFTGDFVTTALSDDTDIIGSSDMFNDPFAHWTKTGTVTQKAEPVSESGYSAVVSGSIKQELFYQQISGESYVISFKAKGTQVTVGCGNSAFTQDLTADYEQYHFKYTSGGGTTFTATGTCEICELQLERGTIPSAWGRSFLDNQTDLVRFESLVYLANAIQNASTTVDGGLILSQIIQLGNYANKVMERVTAGVSGVYNNDNDVAFWAGGTLEQAINTVTKYKNNPAYQPTEGEMAAMANYVATHGGRTILNDVILRGYIYALGGIFKGRVEIAGGKIQLNEDSSGRLGSIEWDTAGNTFGNLMIKRSTNIITSENVRKYIDRESDWDLDNYEFAYINVNSILGGVAFSGAFELNGNGGDCISYTDNGKHKVIVLSFPDLIDIYATYPATFIGQRIAVQNDTNGIIISTGSTHTEGGTNTSFSIHPGEVYLFEAVFYETYHNQKNWMSWLRKKLM